MDERRKSRGFVKLTGYDAAGRCVYTATEALLDWLSRPAATMRAQVREFGIRRLTGTFHDPEGAAFFDFEDVFDPETGMPEDGRGGPAETLAEHLESGEGDA